MATPATSSADLSIFACEPEWKALVEELGGDHVDVYTATTGIQDPHHIEARPSLIAKARSSDMLVCTGGELEIGWLPVVQRSSGNSRIQDGSERVFYAADFVDRLEIPETVDRSSGDVHASGNPHVHLDPHRVRWIASDLSRRLQVIDPANAGRYASLWKDFDSRWEAAMTDWEARISYAKGTRVITHHRTWSYLFDWIGWEYAGELEPVPGSPPTARHLAQLLDAVPREKPSLILIATYQDPKGANWLSGQADLPVIPLPATVGGSSDSQDLFALFDSIIADLTNALPQVNQ